MSRFRDRFDPKLKCVNPRCPIVMSGVAHYGKDGLPYCTLWCEMDTRFQRFGYFRDKRTPTPSGNPKGTRRLK